MHVYGLTEGLKNTTARFIPRALSHPPFFSVVFYLSLDTISFFPAIAFFLEVKEYGIDVVNSRFISTFLVFLGQGQCKVWVCGARAGHASASLLPAWSPDTENLSNLNLATLSTIRNGREVEEKVKYRVFTHHFTMFEDALFVFLYVCIIFFFPCSNDAER